MRGIGGMSGLIDFLMSEESWNPEVGVSVHFIEFENVSLLKLVDPDGDLFRSDIFIAGEDLHLDAFGSVSLASHIIRKIEKADEEQATVAGDFAELLVRVQFGLDGSIACHENTFQSSGRTTLACAKPATDGKELRAR
jgi:hypothetical protein